MSKSHCGGEKCEKHPYSTDQCGCSCSRCGEAQLVEPVNEPWTPESKAAHKVRCEFAELMGLGFTSIRDPKWLVENFKMKILREAQEKK